MPATLSRTRTTPQGSTYVNGHSSTDVEAIFGSNTFGLAEMKSRLPKAAYKRLTRHDRGRRAVRRDPSPTPSPSR